MESITATAHFLLNFTVQQPIWDVGRLENGANKDPFGARLKKYIGLIPTWLWKSL
jgi:hypothetical protein